MNAVDTVVSERLRSQPHELPTTARDTPNPVACGSRHGPRWFVIQTHPQAEAWALENLERQGFDAYLPLHAVRIRDRALRTMTRIVERPLFTSYLFARFDAHRDPWRPICSTQGVRRLFMSDTHRPTPVRAGAVEAVRELEAVRRRPTTPGALWAAGAPCRLAGGPLAGAEAVVISTTADRALVSLLVFGALREVQVGVDALEPRGDA